MFEIIALLSVNQKWLLTAILLLSILLPIWLVRYSNLYREYKLRAEQYSNSLDELDEGFFRGNIDGVVTYVNPAMVRMFGLDCSNKICEIKNEMIDSVYVKPGRREEFKRQLVADGQVREFVSEIRNISTGKTIWIEENVHVVNTTGKDQSFCYEGSIRDITDAVLRKRLEDRLEKLSRNLPGGLFQLLVDEDGTFSIPYYSHGLLELMDKDVEAISHPKFFIDAVIPEHRDKYAKSLKNSLKTGECWEVELKIIKSDGSELWVGLVATLERLDKGATIFHGHIKDITARKETEAQVAYYAYYDPLTRLPNRTFFIRSLDRFIASSARSGNYGAILFLDIDKFKLLNDTLGHAKGDLLLKMVASRLKKVTGENDIVSRFGGDEFVVLLDGIGNNSEQAKANAANTGRLIISQFRQGFELGDDGLQNSSPSIGMVVFNGDGFDSDTLIKNADTAMYEAKKLGRNNIVTFSDSDNFTAKDLVQLQSRLGTAIKEGELSIFYQAQIDHNGDIFGAEALVRWEHPELGFIAPGDFIPLAEQSGLICKLNDFVFKQSMENLANWRAEGCDKYFRLAINVSAQQLYNPEFIPSILDMAKSCNVPLSLLTFEIREKTIARDFDTIASKMQEIRELGIKMSIDNFGSGYSSLSQLSILPIDEVKIDGTIIAGLEDNKSNHSLVETIVACAKALRLELVAEHVNSSFQERFLLARGCRKFQGFSYSKPLPEEKFREFLFNKNENCFLIQPNQCDIVDTGESHEYYALSI